MQLTLIRRWGEHANYFIIAGDDDQTAGKKAIMGALRLYLDFINLFIMLMQLFGVARE